MARALGSGLHKGIAYVLAEQCLAQHGAIGQGIDFRLL